MVEVPKWNWEEIYKTVDLTKIIPYRNFVVFDFEWDYDGIWAASFVNHLNEKKVLHLKNYLSDPDRVFGRTALQKLLIDINKEIMAYECSVGWNTMGEGSDLFTLDQCCERNKVESIVTHVGAFLVIRGRAHIDLMKVFEKKLVQLSTFENAYRNVKLETVSQCFLGEGKLGNGEEAHKYDFEKQKAYVLQDSILVRKLMYVGGDKDGYKMDGGILGVFVAITKIIEESRVLNGVSEQYRMAFDRVTQTNLTTWWAQILRNYRAPEANPAFKVKAKYEGGAILDPMVGKYEELEVVDVQSLYPTIIINYNISHETINCEHGLECNPTQVPGLPYTICGRRKGIFSQICAKYKKLRVEYKNAGDKTMATGLKIFLNGGYGAYGNEYFRYADMRVAAAVTAFGRWITTKQLKPQAESLGFQVPYGDTDSLFLNWAPDIITEHQRNMTLEQLETPQAKKDAVKALIKWAETDMDIVLEHEKTFKWVVLVGKKHYVGRMYNKKENRILIKGMEGKKGDRCKWVRSTFDAIIEAIDKNTNPVVIFDKALDNLKNNRVDHNDLKIWTRLSKDPTEYAKNCASKQVGMLHNATTGDVVWYFKAKSGATLSYDALDKDKYIDQLRTAVEELLKHCGYDVSKNKKGQGDASMDYWTVKKEEIIKTHLEAMKKIAQPPEVKA